MADTRFVPLSAYVNPNLFSFIELPHDALDSIGVADSDILVEWLVTVDDEHTATYNDGIEEDEFGGEEIIATWADAEVAKTSAVSFTVVNSTEVPLTIPGLDGVELVIAPTGSDTFGVTLTIHEDDTFEATAGINFKLRFDRELLKPMTGPTVVDGRAQFEVDDSIDRVEIEIGEVAVSLDSDGFHFGSDLSFGIDRPVMIGDSGVILNELTGMAFNFTGDGARPSNVPAGEDWRGIYIGNAELYIPDVLSGAISVEGLGIGSGGVYADISYTGSPPLEYDSDTKTFSGDPALTGQVLGLEGGIASISLELVQTIPVGTRLVGKILLPFFDEPVDVEISINLDGSFAVKLTNTDADGLYTLTKPGLLSLTVESLAFEVVDGEFAARLSGSLQPLVDIGGTDWPAFDVKEMTIYADGRVDLDGGWLDLPEQYQLDFHGFSMELTQMGFGETDDGDRWIGFSGSLQLAADLGLGAEFDGLRILWNPGVSTDIRFSLEGVGVDLTIPDVLSLEGTVRFIDDDTQRGFKGGVKLVLYSVNLEIDAEMLVIKRGGFTAFYIYVNSNFPAGIPLASTGVALYGLAGLYGQNVEPDKTEEEQWYENWYKGNRLGEGGTSRGVAASDKWAPERGSMAFGAGVTLGTATDDGYTVNGKLLLAILLPGPIILLEGRANLLSERSELAADGSEPNFEALAVLDNRAGQFLMNVAAQYKKDDEGRIIDIRAGAEAFFDYHRADAWHLYLGQDEPREKRIRAEVISLFRADSYFMLSARDLRMGFWVGYDESWSFGPLRVGLSAWITADAMVSWKPAHAHGQLQLHGGFELSAFGFGLALQVDARIAADTPTPFYIVAELHVELSLPWPLPDPRATVSLEWGDEDRQPPIALPLGAVACEHVMVSEKWPLDRLPLYDEDGDGFWDDVDPPGFDEEAQLARTYNEDDQDGDGLMGTPVVPLDGRPVLSFAKPVYDDIGFGDGRDGLIEAVGNNQFKYHLVVLTLEKASRGILGGTPSWTVVARRSGDPGVSEIEPDKLRGTWQVVNSGDDNLPNAKLMLWSRSTFDWAREQAGPMYWTWVRGHLPDLDCPPPSPWVQTCVDWDDEPAGTVYAERFTVDHLEFWRPGEPAEVVYRPRALFSRLHGIQLVGRSHFLGITGFPYGTKAVTLSLDNSSQTIARAFADGSKVDEQYVDPGLINVTLEASEIDAVSLEASGDVYLYRVCYQAPLNPERQRMVEEWAGRRDETREAWRSTDELLEPDYYYRLTVETEVKQNDTVAQHFVEKIYLQTDQPPGVYPPSTDDTTVANQHEHYPDQGPLRDLSPYVQYTVPAPESRAVYRAYDTGAYFNQNYVDAMYRRALKPLKVFLYDAEGEPVAGLLNVWGRNPTLTLTRTEVEWLMIRDETTCRPGVEWTDVPADEHLNAYAQGLLLRSETRYEARLVADGIELPEGDGSQYPVFEWQFITSRYAHFRHHIGSFHDWVWDEHVLRGRPETPLLTSGQLAELETLVAGERSGTPAPAGDPPRFEEIAFLFGFGTEPEPAQPGRWLRPTAREVDITLLRDGDRRYGLLLESPEPLGEQRVTVAAEYNDTLTPLFQPPGVAKVLAARLAPAGSGVNDEYVDLLLLEDQDLSEWRIEHTGSADPEDETFSTYYTFPASSILKEGTVIRVHSGHAADDSTPAATYQHHYVEAGSFQLNAGGDWLRLVDTQGNIVHSRFFLQSDPSAYATREMVAVWNTDHTAAFLFFPAGTTAVGDISDGQYRLVCTFKRELAGHPTLKQENETSDEVAFLDLVIREVIDEDYHRWFGDVNLDNIVDARDIQAIAARWRRPAVGEDALYDINDDGEINMVDIMRAVRNWGRRPS